MKVWPRNLLLLTLVVGLIDTGRILGGEAKNVLKREAQDDSGESTEIATESKESEDSGADHEADGAAASSRSDGEATIESSASEDSQQNGSRSGAAAAVVASASASSSASSGAAPADLTTTNPPAAGASVSTEAASTAISSNSTDETVVTEEVVGSRSGANEESSSTKRPIHADTTRRAKEAGSDDKSDHDNIEIEEESSAAKEDSPEKGKEIEGESRAGLFPDLFAKASAGLNMNFFQNSNKTLVISMRANLNGESGKDTSGAPTTPGPALVLDKDGTKLMSQGGTLRPVHDEQVKEIVEKARSDPKSFKIESFQSLNEYDEIKREAKSTQISKRELLMNNQRTTPEPKISPKTTHTTKPTSSKSTFGPSTGKPMIDASGSTTSNRPNVFSTKSAAPKTLKPLSTTVKPILPVKGTSESPAQSSPRPPSSTNSPFSLRPRSTVQPNTEKISSTTTANPTPKSPKCITSIAADFQSSDKLLAIAITNKGYFKGRRINAKAIEKIMQGKLNSTPDQIDKGITISTNNSYVFPAGHYYFPHPIRFVGFQSP